MQMNRLFGMIFCRGKSALVALAVVAPMAVGMISTAAADSAARNAADPHAEDKKRMVILLEHCTGLASWANDINSLTHFNHTPAVPNVFRQYGWTHYDQISFLVNDEPQNSVAQQHAGKQVNFLLGPTGILATDETGQSMCNWPQHFRPLVVDYTRSVPANAPAILGVTGADQSTMNPDAHREKRTQFVLMGECPVLVEVADDIVSVAMEIDSSSESIYNNLGWVQYDTIGVKIGAQPSNAHMKPSAGKTAFFMIGTTGVYTDQHGQALCGWAGQFKPLDKVYPRNVPAEHPRVAKMFK